MKITVLTTLLFCGVSLITFSQKEECKNDQTFTETLKPKIKKSEKDSLKIHPGTLNYFFKSQLNSVAFSSEDLSLQRFYATLTNEDNAFSFGLNFNNLRKTDDKATWILSLGVGGKSTGSFATFFESSNGETVAKTEINGKLKFTWLGRGIITRYSSQRAITNEYYKKYLGPKYDKKLEAFKKTDGDKYNEINKLEALNGKAYLSEADSSGVVCKHYKALRSEFMKEEAKAIIDNRLYRRMWDHWITFEATLPIAKKQYKLSDSIQNPVYDKKGFYGWNFTMKYTNMWKSSKNNAVYLSGRARVYNDNNIITEDLKSADFLSFVNQSSTQSATSKTDEVYIGRFDEFATLGLGAEVIWYPWNQWVGVSASVEQMVSASNYLNWKFGIPVSLKDDEGESKVNFELQWKEVNKNHYVGANIGFVLGKFIGK